MVLNCNVFSMCSVYISSILTFFSLYTKLKKETYKILYLPLVGNWKKIPFLRVYLKHPQIFTSLNNFKLLIFQRKRLPHAHVLFFICNVCKFTDNLQHTKMYVNNLTDGKIFTHHSMSNIWY